MRASAMARPGSTSPPRRGLGLHTEEGAHEHLLDAPTDHGQGATIDAGAAAPGHLGAGDTAGAVVGAGGTAANTWDPASHSRWDWERTAATAAHEELEEADALVAARAHDGHAVAGAGGIDAEAVLADEAVGAGLSRVPTALLGPGDHAVARTCIELGVAGAARVAVGVVCALDAVGVALELQTYRVVVVALTTLVAGCDALVRVRVAAAATAISVRQALNAFLLEEEGRITRALFALTDIRIGVADATGAMLIRGALDALSIEEVWGRAFARDARAADGL